MDIRDIWLMIFRYLNIKELCKLHCVCIKFKKYTTKLKISNKQFKNLIKQCNNLKSDNTKALKTYQKYINSSAYVCKKIYF
jgi:hypothetical protein